VEPIVLPAVNASLNAIATSLLIVGRLRVRRGDVPGHRRAMLQAFAVSCAFLVLYVLHKAGRGFENTPYNGEGALRIFYLAMLASHVLLAMAVPVLALLLIRFGLGGRIAQHRRLARFAWPIWLYVSVTGVAIFLMLYPLNPAPG
jgi:uncharacterized membrane protein YozB (DUF420 family)